MVLLKEMKCLAPFVIIISLIGETNFITYKPHMIDNLVDQLGAKISEN